MTLTGPEREMGAGSQTLHIPCGGVLVVPAQIGRSVSHDTACARTLTRCAREVVVAP